MSEIRKLPSHLETERLLLRPVERGDLDFFIALHGDRDVVRFLGGDGTPRTPEMTEAWLERMLRWYERDNLGPFALAQREDRKLVGRTGLSIFEIEETPSASDGMPIATWGIGSGAEGVPVRPLLELGYVVHPSAQGTGYATEGSRAWLKFAFEEWDEPYLHSVIAAGNTPSLRVAEKNGLRPTGLDVRMDGKPYGCFRRDRDTWS